MSSRNRSLLIWPSHEVWIVMASTDAQYPSYEFDCDK